MGSEEKYFNIISTLYHIYTSFTISTLLNFFKIII